MFEPDNHSQVFDSGRIIEEITVSESNGAQHDPRLPEIRMALIFKLSTLTSSTPAAGLAGTFLHNCAAAGSFTYDSMQAKCIEALILKSEWRSLVLQSLETADWLVYSFAIMTRVVEKGQSGGPVPLQTSAHPQKPHGMGQELHIGWLMSILLATEYGCLRHRGVQNQSPLNRFSHMPHWSHMPMGTHQTHRPLTPTTNTATATADTAAAMLQQKQHQQQQQQALFDLVVFVWCDFRNSLKHSEHFIRQILIKPGGGTTLGDPKQPKEDFLSLATLSMLSLWQTLPSRPWAQHYCASLGTWLPKVLLALTRPLQQGCCQTAKYHCLRFFCVKILLLLFLGSTCTKYVQT